MAYFTTFGYGCSGVIYAYDTVNSAMNTTVLQVSSRMFGVMTDRDKANELITTE